MLIRNFEIKDIDTVAEFELQIALISFGDEAITDLSFHRRKLEKALSKEGGGMLIMEDEDGIIAGWLWMAPKVNFVTEETYINFKSFYVSEAHRGSSSAEQLLEAGMTYSRSQQAGRIVGYVHVSNLPMRTLYKKFGFAPTHLTMEYNMHDSVHDRVDLEGR